MKLSQESRFNSQQRYIQTQRDNVRLQQFQERRLLSQQRYRQTLIDNVRLQQFQERRLLSQQRYRQTLIDNVRLQQFQESILQSQQTYRQTLTDNVRLQQFQERRLHSQQRYRQIQGDNVKLQQFQDSRLQSQQTYREIERDNARLEHHRKSPCRANLVVKSTGTRKADTLVCFDKPTFERQRNRDFVINMTIRDMNANTEKEYHNVRFTESILTLQCKFDLKLGCQFWFQLNLLQFSPISRKFVPILEEVAMHKEVLLKSELEELMSRAVGYSKTWNKLWLPVEFAYRNKTFAYFANIMLRRRGIMECYPKDNNGDPGCPINSQIDSLFFAVRPDPETEHIPDVSPFGDTRVTIPMLKLFDTCVNLYFADFYCTNAKGIHYVTLVVTKPNSIADRFCNTHLPRLSLYENPFLRFHRSPECYGFICPQEPRVELLYTENIDLNEQFVKWQTNVRTLGNGSSTPGGLPKRPNCRVCNLYPEYYDHIPFNNYDDRYSY